MANLRDLLTQFARKIDIETQMTGKNLRDSFRKNGRDIGMYSYGCFDTKRIGKNVTIGRYCSFADSVRIFTRNHGISFISTTPYLYNETIGGDEVRELEHTPCVIEDDVWIGHNAIILPGARRIGRGSIIGAGAVITKPVDRYTIVGGNPARKLRDRFPPEVCEQIEKTEWWMYSIEELKEKARSSSDFVYSPVDFFKHELRKQLGLEQ